MPRCLICRLLPTFEMEFGIHHILMGHATSKAQMAMIVSKPSVYSDLISIRLFRLRQGMGPLLLTARDAEKRFLTP